MSDFVATYTEHNDMIDVVPKRSAGASHSLDEQDVLSIYIEYGRRSDISVRRMLFAVPRVSRMFPTDGTYREMLSVPLRLVDYMLVRGGELFVSFRGLVDLQVHGGSISPFIVSASHVMRYDGIPDAEIISGIMDAINSADNEFVKT